MVNSMHVWLKAMSRVKIGVANIKIVAIIAGFCWFKFAFQCFYSSQELLASVIRYQTAVND